MKQATTTTAFLLASILAVGNGFSFSSSKNSKTTYCRRKPCLFVGKDGCNELKRIPPIDTPMDTLPPQTTARKTITSFTRELTKSAMVAAVATTTLTAGSSYLAPMPAFAKDTIAMETTSKGASALSFRTFPPSIISSIETANLVIANGADEETTNDHPQQQQLVMMAADPTPNTALQATRGHTNNNAKKDTTALAARKRERTGPQGETVLLVLQAPTVNDNKNHEQTTTATTATTTTTTTTTTAALASRQRERADPPGETYLLVQATAVEEANNNFLVMEEVELTEKASIMEEQTLVVVADMAVTDASDPDDEAIAVFTAELTKEQEDSMAAMGVESDEDFSSEGRRGNMF